MSVRHTRSISGSGDTFPYDELAELVASVQESMEVGDRDDGRVTVKQWRSSGDSGGYGAVEAGWKIEVSWG